MEQLAGRFVGGMMAGEEGLGVLRGEGVIDYGAGGFSGQALAPEAAAKMNS